MEELIEAVRQRPCLWDVNSQYYRNPEMKDKAWREIVQLRLPGIRNFAEARAQWKRLRDNHRDSLKRFRSSNHARNNWKYADSMEFLLPFMKLRKIRYLSSDEPQSPRNDDEECENNDDCREISVATPSIETYTYSLDDCENDEHATKSKQDDEVLELIKDIKDNQRKREVIREIKNMQREKHPMVLFLESMAMTIKKMPPWMQIRVKRKIFAVVSEAEDELQYSAPVADAPDEPAAENHKSD